MLGEWLRRVILAKEGKRNPLGDPPLRLPGQGVSERLYDESLAMLLAVVLPLIMPLLSVGVFFLSIKARGWPDGMELLQALLLWLFAIVLFGYVAWRKRATVRNLRLGMLAERMVGQQLERCRTHGYFIFHDIECEGKAKAFNIDHLAIGPGGIFVVETKARSKPETGETVAWVQGNTVQFSDGSNDATALLLTADSEPPHEALPSLLA